MKAIIVLRSSMYLGTGCLSYHMPLNRVEMGFSLKQIITLLFFTLLNRNFPLFSMVKSLNSQLFEKILYTPKYVNPHVLPCNTQYLHINQLFIQCLSGQIRGLERLLMGRRYNAREGGGCSIFFSTFPFIFFGQKGRRAKRPVTEGRGRGWCAYAWILSLFNFFAFSRILTLKVVVVQPQRVFEESSACGEKGLPGLADRSFLSPPTGLYYCVCGGEGVCSGAPLRRAAKLGRAGHLVRFSTLATSPTAR